MNTGEKLRTANGILRQLDGDFPGSDGIHQKFKWCWSQDLISLVPEFDHDGQPKYQYICQCGVDREIHSPQCSSMVRARIKMMKISSLGPQIEEPRYRRAWMLCSWVAPPPFDAWMDMMGSEEDYPAHGRYTPVSWGKNMVALNADMPPDEEASWAVVRMIRQHAETWRKTVADDAEKAAARMTPLFDKRGNLLEPAHPSSSYHQMHDRLKSAMTYKGHIPGKKDNTVIFTEKQETTENAASTTTD